MPSCSVAVHGQVPTLHPVVDYYLMVDHQGVPQIVDAMGGITVNQPVAIGRGHRPRDRRRTTSSQDQHLDGLHALWFARGRYGSDHGQHHPGRPADSDQFGLGDAHGHDELFLWRKGPYAQSIAEAFSVRFECPDQAGFGPDFSQAAVQPTVAASPTRQRSLTILARIVWADTGEEECTTGRSATNPTTSPQARIGNNESNGRSWEPWLLRGGPHP